MNTFTISPQFLRQIDRDSLFYFADVLFVFPQTTNDFKVAIDRDGHILDIYKNIDNHKDLIKAWLDLLANNKASFEFIDASIGEFRDEIKKALELCYEVNGSKQLIVFSRQDVKRYKIEDKAIVYNGEKIVIFDRDEIRLHFSKRPIINNYTIENSQIATTGGALNQSNNK